jgi:hypothetical protein
MPTARPGQAVTTLKSLKRLVERQAKDEGLWFIAEYASEAYLQKALRLLHEAIERLQAKP